MKFFILRTFAMIMFVVGISTNVYSQTYSVTYAYDTNGNRISRVITFTNDYRSDVSDTTDVECLIDNINGCDISIYPNPATERISLKIDSYEEGREIVASLYSISGVCLEKKNVSSFLTEFNLGNQSSGTYIIEFSDGNERRTWKIIKE